MSTYSVYYFNRPSASPSATLLISEHVLWTPLFSASRKSCKTSRRFVTGRPTLSVAEIVFSLSMIHRRKLSSSRREFTYLHSEHPLIRPLCHLGASLSV